MKSRYTLSYYGTPFTMTTRTVSQITKDTQCRYKQVVISLKWSSLIFFGPGLSPFVHILRSYTTTI